MAAYNEQQSIRRVVQAVLGIDYACEMELIVVNDGSEDLTGPLLEEISDPRLNVHHHQVNRGKGAALKTAMALARGTHMVPFDTDLEYLLEDLPRLLDPIIKGKCNVVYGTRMFGVNTVHRSYRYAVGNRFLSRLANMLFDSCISDLHTCLKLIPLEMVPALTLTENGFGLDTEITASLLRHGVRPFEVPISYYNRSHAQGKKIKWRDAVECILFQVRMRSVQGRPECFKAASFRPYQAPAFLYRPAPQFGSAGQGPVGALRGREPVEAVIGPEPKDVRRKSPDMEHLRPVIAMVTDAIHPYHRGGKEMRYHELSRRLADYAEVHIYTMNCEADHGGS